MPSLRQIFLWLAERKEMSGKLQKHFSTELFRFGRNIIATIIMAMDTTAAVMDAAVTVAAADIATDKTVQDKKIRQTFSELPDFF